jgi:hypothetical protein
LQDQAQGAGPLSARGQDPVPQVRYPQAAHQEKEVGVLVRQRKQGDDINPFYGLEALVPWLKDLYAFERQQEAFFEGKEYTVIDRKYPSRFYDSSYKPMPRQMTRNK